MKVDRISHSAFAAIQIHSGLRNLELCTEFSKWPFVGTEGAVELSLLWVWLPCTCTHTKYQVSDSRGDGSRLCPALPTTKEPWKYVRGLWPSVSSPAILGSVPISWLLPWPSPVNLSTLNPDGCQSICLAQPVAQALMTNMAAGKGAPPSPSAANRWQLSDPEQGQGCKPVLLEKTNHLGSEAAMGRDGRDAACAELALSAATGKPRLGKPLPQKVCGEQRQSTLTELPRLKERLGGHQAQEREQDDPVGQPGPLQLTQDIPRDLAGSTVFSVWPSGARGEQRSAFSKPAKRPAERPGPSPIFPASECADSLGKLSGLLNAVDMPCGRISTPKLLVSDFWNLQMLPQNSSFCSTFLGGPTLWLEHTQARVLTPSSSSPTSWALLPPTLTSLGLSTQNWCAKCNLSFRLTSDLVFHMRSHHKKEPAGPDPPSKKRREEALTCPVCQEYFRERHHLSRHMTSHS
ncbi:zinc finger protein 488 [Nycticebus coucang]|uniref:zinc finger protein 488 n=1 Tax=Nycticebus coucang TaxID=9470 RepID=UPI00234C2E32|nr:zinc finger protein 488 [Nycticebus coucang]